MGVRALHMRMPAASCTWHMRLCHGSVGTLPALGELREFSDIVELCELLGLPGFPAARHSFACCDCRSQGLKWWVGIMLRRLGSSGDGG